jgi:hypothetical protein
VFIFQKDNLYTILKNETDRTAFFFYQTLFTANKKEKWITKNFSWLISAFCRRKPLACRKNLEQQEKTFNLHG